PASAENGREDQEVDDRQNGASGQGHYPGGEDGTDDPQVECGDTPGHADPENGTDQRVGGGNRQTQTGGADHGGGGSELCGKTAAGGQLGDVLADGSDHPVAIGGQADHDTDGAQQQYPAGNRRLGLDHPGLQHTDDGGQRPDGVGHVIGAVGKGHGAGGEDHQDGKDPLHSLQVPAVILFLLDAAHQRDAEDGHHRTGQQ